MRRIYTPKEIKTREKIKSAFLSILIVWFTLYAISVYQANETLTENKRANLVDVGSYDLNVSIFGNAQGAHRLVGISGLQHGDFSISTARLTEELQTKNQLIFIDRAGYGLSDDTLKPLTVDRVVDDYRKALTVSGIKSPYVLLAEHYGGVYATYWEMKYPDEIEAIVFIDGTEMHESESEAKKEDTHSYLLEGAKSVLSKVGLGKLLQSNKLPHYPSSYTPAEKNMGESLMLFTVDSLAPVIEMSKQWDNIEYTHATVSRNSIPKLYITSDERWSKKAPVPSDNGYDFGNVVRLTVRDPSDTLTPYLDQMGNCRLTYLGGVGHLYEYKPKECAKIVQSFLNNLEHYSRVVVN